jgi:hypothetical protein
MANQYEKKSNSLYGTPLEIWHNTADNTAGDTTRDCTRDCIIVIEEAFSVTRDKKSVICLLRKCLFGYLTLYCLLLLNCSTLSK